MSARPIWCCWRDAWQVWSAVRHLFACSWPCITRCGSTATESIAYGVLSRSQRGHSVGKRARSLARAYEPCRVLPRFASLERRMIGKGLKNMYGPPSGRNCACPPAAGANWHTREPCRSADDYGARSSFCCFRLNQAKRDREVVRQVGGDGLRSWSDRDHVRAHPFEGNHSANRRPRL